MIGQHRIPRAQSAACFAAVFTLLFAVMSTAGRTEEEHAEEPTKPAAADRPPSDVVGFPVNDPRQDEARRQAKDLGIVLLGGILIIGTALVAFVMIWGHRIRRTAREPLPPVSRLNELWFLKPQHRPGPAEENPAEPHREDE
jgi:hypothetical protein